MIDQNSRPARKVGIADHLWETYEDMAQQMGSERDALINQALFMFARLNGFIEVGRTARGGAAPGGAARSASPKSAAPVLQPVSSRNSPSSRDDLTPQPGPAPQRPSARGEERSPSHALDNDPARREVAERVLETAAELERLIKGKSGEPREELDDDALEDEFDSSMGLSPDGSLDEGPLDDDPLGGAPLHDDSLHDDHLNDRAGDTLFLLMDSAEPQAIVRDRFVIGRGKHCDLVINSGKVSREHAVIVRDGADFFIEDLGSSNGTWFNKQRIKRRKIEDGDEYFVCSERIRLAFQ
jgi:hypothetical protein